MTRLCTYGVIVWLVASSSAQAGVIHATITKLLGEPRADTQLFITLKTRESNSKRTKDLLVRHPGKTDAVGQLDITVPDDPAAYFLSSTELILILEGSATSKIARITVPFILGTDEKGTPVDYTITLVMKDISGTYGELAGMAFRGTYGTFLLAGDTGTCMYKAMQSGKCLTRITALELVLEDDQFFFYRETDSERVWAFRINPQSICCHNVWVRNKYGASWKFYEAMRRADASNSYEVERNE